MLEPRAADIWRLDVTTVGGFTEARRVLGLASAFGIAVSPHIYVELHVHLAASDAGVISVEYVTRDSEIDLSHRFLAGTLEPENGRLSLPTAPGLGIELDLERIRCDRRGVLPAVTAGRRPTLDDVAAQAGVSRSTVSRVINAHAYVADDVRAAVMRAIAEIGYVPNESARALRTNRTMTVGLVVTRLRNQVFAAIAQSLDEALMAAGRTLLAGSSADDASHEAHVVSCVPPAWGRRPRPEPRRRACDGAPPRHRRSRDPAWSCSTGTRGASRPTRCCAVITRASPRRSRSSASRATSASAS